MTWISRHPMQAGADDFGRRRIAWETVGRARDAPPTALNRAIAMLLHDLEGTRVELARLPPGRDDDAHVHARPHAVLILSGTLIDRARNRAAQRTEAGQLTLNPAGAAHLLDVPDDPLRCVLVEFPQSKDWRRTHTLRAPFLARRIGAICMGCVEPLTPARSVLAASEIRAAFRVAERENDFAEAPDWIRETAALLSGIERISVARAARNAGVHRATLSAGFREAFGVSPRTFRLLAQLERAAEALLAGDSASAAALSAGFTDQAHMGNAWRRTFGTTPLAWLRLATTNLQDGSDRK